VLERVVFRLGEHVQALHRLDERRIGEGETLGRVVGDAEADRD
jgi:hypothetical protein